jgi:hypothetical protein
MAAPHVAGAWAILKQAAPGASVSDILATLRATDPSRRRRIGSSDCSEQRRRRASGCCGRWPRSFRSPITSAGHQRYRPDARRASGSTLTLTVLGNNFSAFSVVRWNGAESANAADPAPQNSPHRSLPAICQFRASRRSAYIHLALEAARRARSHSRSTRRRR